MTTSEAHIIAYSIVGLVIVLTIFIEYSRKNVELVGKKQILENIAQGVTMSSLVSETGHYL